MRRAVCSLALVLRLTASFEFLQPFRTRVELPAMLEAMGLRTGVELGIERGIFTSTMLHGWPSCINYTQVDLWSEKALKGSHYKDSQSNHNVKYQTMLGQKIPRPDCTATFGDAHVRWPNPTCGLSLRKCHNFTTACATEFSDAAVDFVYVDALHDRVGVLRDLEAWWPKLRAGGVMAGHDYMTQDDLNSFNDKAAGTKWPQQQNIDGTFDTEGGMVKGAVDDFFSCAVVVGDGHERAPERKRTAAHCDHLRTVIVAYGAQVPNSKNRHDADDWPRSWYVKK